MAKDDYQDDDQKVASYFDDITSPLTAAGIDPDEALMNRDAALAKVSGQQQPDASPAPMPDYPGGANYPSRPSETGGGSSTVASTGTPPAAPSTPAEPDMQSYVQQGLQGQLRATQGAEDTVKKMATMPSEDPALTSLEARRTAAAAPINSQDPKYRPSIGQKVLRGVRGFLSGGLPGAARTDYNAPTRQYGIDRATQEANVGNLDQQIAQARKNYEEATARLKNVAAEQGKVGLGYKDITSGATAQENATNKGDLEKAQADLATEKANNTANSEPKNETELSIAFTKARQAGDKAGMQKYGGSISLLKTLRAAGRDIEGSRFKDLFDVHKYGQDETTKIYTEMDRERKESYSELDRDRELVRNPQKMKEARAEVDSKLEAKYGPRIQSVHDDAAEMLEKISTPTRKTNAPRQGDTPSKPAGSSPDSHVFSVSAWQRANPHGDAVAAKKAAAANGYTVVQ